MDPLILLLMFGIPLASQAVASTLRKRFVQHSREPMPMTGAEIARRMLAENHITDVQVIPTKGQLTDHYNPVNKTVALSEIVYSQANVAACAVAAHECGHAVQDATGYPLLTMRSKMVPLLRLSNVALPVIALWWCWDVCQPRCECHGLRVARFDRTTSTVQPDNVAS